MTRFIGFVSLVWRGFVFISKKLQGLNEMFSHRCHSSKQGNSYVYGAYELEMILLQAVIEHMHLISICIDKQLSAKSICGI